MRYSRRCFELGEDVEYVSREIGYSRMSIYAWRRKYLKYGMVGTDGEEKKHTKGSDASGSCIA